VHSPGNGARLAESMRMESAEARLRYIDGSKVQTPGGQLDQLDVLNQEDSNVGRVEGIVVDPAERQVRYFVFKSRRALRARHYLLPLAPATIDAENKALHVDAQTDDLDELIDGPAKRFPPFTDDDLLTALFANRTH
jgi:hypothetical protein